MLPRSLAKQFAVSLAGVLGVAAAIAVSIGSWPARAACGADVGNSSATLLVDGRLLVLVSRSNIPGVRAEIYDPAANRWTPAGISREGDTVATLLADGRVLLTGGLCDPSGPQLYDPRTDISAPAARMIFDQLLGYTATLLRNGKVLFAGGAPYEWVGTLPPLEELYDPVTNRWSPAAGMPVARLGHQGLRLADGRVLVVTGKSVPYGSNDPPPAVVYDPIANTWSSAGTLTMTGSVALSLLGNGMVLAAGGTEDGMPSSSAEVFDPVTRTWSRTGPMTFGRAGASATLLPDGRVLVLGGLGISGLPLTTGEFFDPHTNDWALAPPTLRTGHLEQAGVRLGGGRLFVTGWSDHWSPADVEVVDPTQAGAAPTPTSAPTGPGTWSSAASTAAPHVGHTATLLADGRVFVLGTGAEAPEGMTGEIYDPSTGRWSTTARVTGISPEGFTATLLSTGKVLVVGRRAQLYDPSSDRWSPAGNMLVSRNEQTATRLADGRVLVAGGGGGLEIYNPDSNSWSAAGNLPADVDPGGAFTGDGFSATLLRNGRVLFIGGCTSKAAVFDPSAGTWSAAGSLRRGNYADYTVRDCDEGYTTTLLPNGKVLTAGGYLINAGALPPPELYDPATNRWSPAGAMLLRRHAHSAALLQNGLVLIAGGDTGKYAPGLTATAELYEPTSNRWFPTASMMVARSSPTATALKNGMVLVVGGYFLGNLRSAELYTLPGHRILPAVSSHVSTWILSLAAILAIPVLVAVAAAALLAVRARHRKRRPIPFGPGPSSGDRPSSA